jgi:hypothetical protein
MELGDKVMHVPQILLYTIFYFMMEFKDFLVENNPVRDA